MKKLGSHFSGVHVLLVSLLVDQLSGLFLIFLVDQKIIVLSQKPDKIFFVSLWFFLVSLWFFCSPSTRETDQKNSETDQKNSETDQNFFVRSLRLDNYFWSTKKKREIDRTIGWPRDWPKVHGRRFWKTTLKNLRITFFEKKLEYFCKNSNIPQFISNQIKSATYSTVLIIKLWPLLSIICPLTYIFLIL